MADDDPGTYKVGYQRPPEGSQFRKGQSGNPDGRPAKSHTASSIVRRVCDERIRATINGKEQNITSLEAALRKVLNTVMTKGNVLDLERFLRLSDKYGGPPADDRMAQARAEGDKVIQRMFEILDRTVEDDGTTVSRESDADESGDKGGG